MFSSLVRAYLFLVLCSFSFICGISEIIGTEGRRNSLLDKASDMKFKRAANGVGTYGNYHKNFSEIILQICHKTDSVQSGTMTFHKKQKRQKGLQTNCLLCYVMYLPSCKSYSRYLVKHSNGKLCSVNSNST